MIKNMIVIFSLSSTGLALSTTLVGVAMAQESSHASAGDGSGIEEIVVTAQRRSERLQDVPISINAVTADKLASSGVDGIANLDMAVPSLNVGNGNGYLITHLRGVGSIDNGPGIENQVALYVDGVYYANQSVGLFSFNNIAQVEVLKGPQGTLFGRNATGGLIQVITRDPTQEFQMKTTVGAANYRGFDGNMYVAGGLTSNLVADFSVSGSRRDGWGNNVATGEQVADVPRDLAMRSKWIYTPGDAWKFTLIADLTNRLSSNNALAVAPGTYAIRGLTPPASYQSPWDVDTNVQPQILQRNGGASLKAEYNFDAFTVSNLAAYRKARLDNHFDYDGSTLPLADIRIEQSDYQYSDELQVTSRSSGPLQWVAGAYYFRAEGEIDPNTINFSTSPAFNPNYPLGTLFIYGATHTESISGYGQATYAINEQFDVTAGVRYSYEHRDLDASETGQLLVPGNPSLNLLPLSYLGGEVFKDPTYRIALDYKPMTDWLLYASWNTGFKSGGFNATNPTDPSFKPEKLAAYEVGEKVEFLDHRVRVNSAAFYYDYKDIQTQQPEAASTGIINGGKAHLYGLDGDITVVPMAHLELTAGVALLHATYDTFPNSPISSPGGGLPVVNGSAAGKDMPYAPRATLDIGAAYTVPLERSSLVFDGQYYHNTGFYFEPDNVAQQGAYNQFNASVRWKTADDHYSVLLYGDNLGNVAVFSTIITTPSGQQLSELAAPRTYGVRFTYQY